MHEEERAKDYGDERIGEPGAEATSPSTSPGPNALPESGPDEQFHCDLCGAVMIERHCKLICPACGYQRDCSDP